MINKEKWIESLPKQNEQFNEKKNRIDDYRWLNTLPQKNTFSVLGKYSLMTAIFICGLMFVSVSILTTVNSWACGDPPIPTIMSYTSRIVLIVIGTLR